MSGAVRDWRPDHAARLAALALAAALAGAGACAQTNDVHGRLELQDAGLFARADSIDASLGARDRDDLSGNLRITWEPSWDRWSLQVHYVVAFEDGADVSLARAETGLLPTPPATWFNLTDTFVDHGPVIASQTIDRLAIAYSSPDLVVRV